MAVPIDPSRVKDWADFAAAIKPTVAIVVVEDRLGAINQARLAIAYLRRRYDGPIGVWLNAIKKPSKEVAASNRAGLAAAVDPAARGIGQRSRSLPASISCRGERSPAASACVSPSPSARDLRCAAS